MSASAEPRIEPTFSQPMLLHVVDEENPWLGLDSFTEETRHFFHGRDGEIAELARRVQRRTLAILFGQSGLGKTSILRAGLVPRLRREGYCPVYLRVDYSADAPAPSEQIKRAIFRATETAGTWTRPGAAAQGESLWEFLHHRDDVLRDASGRALTPLLIFDQFEEIFTLAQDDDLGRRRAAEFVADLADLVENRAPEPLEASLERDDTVAERFDFNRADYRILIALREDYLAHLESFKAAMPSITQNRMRLARMTGSQALAAVLKPGGRLVPEEVAESIVRFVGGGAELRNAEVEPSLLSLVCRELNNARLAQGRAEISSDLLAGSRDTILKEFYERALGDQPAAVRRFIEEEMLTESGFRESLAEERVLRGFAAAGAADNALATLVNRRLLRIEERLDTRRVELTHDVLCPVVRESRDLRHEREAKEAAERRLAAQRQREIATRRALVRARQVAAGCAVLAIGAAAASVFGYVNMQRARQAEARSEQTRAMAEGARSEAEKLIVYLLDDFYDELAPVGRLDVVASLSKRALDYYGALPAELRTPETERNRALAAVRYGFVLRYQSKLDEAGKTLDEAIPVLRRLHDGGDRSELTVIGLAMGMDARSRVLESQLKSSQALGVEEEAAALLAPLAAQASASRRLQRANAFIMNGLGFERGRNLRHDAAVEAYERARAAYKSLDAADPEDANAAAGYAEAAAWEVQMLLRLNRADEAQKIGEDGLGVAARVLERRPGHMAALRSRGLILGGLASVEAYRYHLQRAAEIHARQIEDWAAFVKLDPGNAIGWNNLAAGYVAHAFTLYGLGRTADAVAEFQRVRDTVSRDPNIALNFMGAVGWIAIAKAELGILTPAERAEPAHRKLAEFAGQVLAPGSFTSKSFAELGGGIDRHITLILGAYPDVRDATIEAIARVEALKPGNETDVIRKKAMLSAFHFDLAAALYNLSDYAGAEANARKALAYLEDWAPATAGDRINRSELRILLGAALAKLARGAEAREFIDPEVQWHRQLIAGGSDAARQQMVLAFALYAAGLASPEQSRRQFAEARRILDALPAAVRGEKSVVHLRRLIETESPRGG